MSEQEKERQRIYDLLKSESKPKYSEIIGIPDLNSLDYSIWGVLENKTNATSHPNIGSFKTNIEEEWNRMSEEFILKACKSFQRCVDTIIEKKKKKKWRLYWVNLLFCNYLLILWFIFLD